MKPHLLPPLAASLMLACQSGPPPGELTGFETVYVPGKPETLRAPLEASRARITPLTPSEAWLHEDDRRMAYLGPWMPGCGLAFGDSCWTPRAKIDLELGALIGERAPGTLSPEDPGVTDPSYATTLAVDRSRRPKLGRYNALVRFPRLSLDWHRFEVSLDLEGNDAFWLFLLDSELDVSMAARVSPRSLRHTRLEMWVIEDRRLSATRQRAMQWSDYFDEVDVILEHPETGELFSHPRVRASDPRLVSLATLPGHHFVHRSARAPVLPYYRR